MRDLGWEAKPGACEVHGVSVWMASFPSSDPRILDILCNDQSSIVFEKSKW